MKVCNPNWTKLDIEPTEIKIRNILGKAIEKEEVNDINLVVEELINNKEFYSNQISTYFESYLYNHGTSAKEGAKYILKSLNKMKQNKKEN